MKLCTEDRPATAIQQQMRMVNQSWWMGESSFLEVHKGGFKYLIGLQMSGVGALQAATQWLSNNSQAHISQEMPYGIRANGLIADLMFRLDQWEELLIIELM